MRIAFLIMAHREYDLLIKSIKRLNHKDIDIYVHFDSKFQIDIKVFSSEFPSFNFFVITQRVDVNWGGYSILKVQLLLLSSAFRNGHYDYFSFISGQDFPLKPCEYILDFFEINKGKEFVEHFMLPAEDHWDGDGGMDRYKYFWPVDEFGFDNCVKFYEKQLIEKVTRNMPNNLTPYGGSNWISISKECTRYILDYLVETPNILPFFSLVVHPEEIFFHTIIMNSPFKENVVNENLRYIDWNSNCSSPRTFDSLEDVHRMLLSNAHFARKFELSKSELVLRILNKP